jgi:hypothetical protein
MFDNQQKIFTNVLTNGLITIQEEYGVAVVAIKLISGVGFYQGTKSLGGAIPSTPIPLAVEKPVTISADSTKYIDGLIIDCQAGGVIEIIAR